MVRNEWTVGDRSGRAEAENRSALRPGGFAALRWVLHPDNPQIRANRRTKHQSPILRYFEIF
jgi:hypothetical protein